MPHSENTYLLSVTRSDSNRPTQLQRIVRILHHLDVIHTAILTHPYITERLLMGRKESNQTKTTLILS